MEAYLSQPQVIIWTIALISLWSLPWKGLALWQSAVRGQKAWFIILLVVNTVGLLEILYLFYFSRRNSITSPQT